MIFFWADQQGGQPVPAPSSSTVKKLAVEDRGGRRKPLVRRVYSENMNDDDACLYFIIRNGKAALPVKYYKYIYIYF